MVDKSKPTTEDYGYAEFVAIYGDKRQKEGEQAWIAWFGIWSAAWQKQAVEIKRLQAELDKCRRDSQEEPYGHTN